MAKAKAKSKHKAKLPTYVWIALAAILVIAIVAAASAPGGTLAKFIAPKTMGTTNVPPSPTPPSPGPSPPIGTTTIDIYPTDDANVWFSEMGLTGVFPNKPYSLTASEMPIYIKFDLSKVPFNAATIVSAKLIFTSEQYTRSFTVWTTSTNWSENTISQTNLPQYIERIGEKSFESGSTRYVSFDVTNYVKQNIGKQVSFMVEGGSSPVIWLIPNRENPDPNLRPKLQVTYTIT
jgi:hypothetical protein